MAKSKNTFRTFFKIIFGVLGAVLAVIALLLMLAPYVNTTIAWGSNTLAVTYSGFALAFGGNAGLTLNGEQADLSEVNSTLNTVGIDPSIEPSSGITALFVLIAVGILLAVIFVLFCWGKKNANVKRGIGLMAALFVLVGGILAFCTCPLAGVEPGEFSLFSFSLSTGMSAGAILTGIAGIASSVCLVVASLLGPKN